MKPKRKRFAALRRCSPQIPVRFATSAYVKSFWLALTVIMVQVFTISRIAWVSRIRIGSQGRVCGELARLPVPHIANSQYFTHVHTSSPARQMLVASTART
jgi:hypothetical protein